METFTPWTSLAGGLLIGLASAMLLLRHRRIAGISGIAAQALTSDGPARAWRLAFVAGLALTGAALAPFVPALFENTAPRSTLVLAIAGLLVGYGTQLGRGCTSGHGVCGLGRLSRRSLAAVLTFMATAAATVFVTRGLLGAGW